MALKLISIRWIRSGSQRNTDTAYSGNGKTEKQNINNSLVFVWGLRQRTTMDKGPTEQIFRCHKKER